MEARTQGGVSRTEDNVLWVVFLQRSKKKVEALAAQGRQGPRASSQRPHKEVRKQDPRPVHSCTVFTLTIWRCSPERDVKKSQEVAMRSSTEGRRMKGALPWTGISCLGSWYPPVPTRGWPFPHGWRLREVSSMRILSLLAVRADLAWQPNQLGNWILSFLPVCLCS